MRHAHTLAVVGLLVLSTAVPVGMASAADPAFSVDIDLPDDFHAGNNTISVTIDNTANDEELFSPMIEIPLGTTLSAPDPSPTTTVDGSTKTRTFAVQNASYQDGDALYVYGQEVPAGESRTYTFTIKVETAGDRTIEADVRPLYNEPNNVRTSVTKTAVGIGTLDVNVTDGSGNALSGASVDVGGSKTTGGVQSLDVAEGDHTVSVTANGRTLPDLDVALSPNEVEYLTFRSPSSLETPHVVASTGNGSVSSSSVVRQTTTAGNASQATTFDLSFTVNTEGGTTIVGIDPPSEIPDAYKQVTATVDGSTVSTTVASDDTRYLTITGAGAKSVKVSYEGYPTGDADGDGSVDASDAVKIAKAVASGSSTNSYGDVNGDGEVSAVDAMYIAQREDGNRDEDYQVS